MGEVYIAEHPQISRRVALKLLHPGSRPTAKSSRFFNEAKAVNDIGHPNIVDIADFGSTVTERGELVYLVMELLDGVTLTAVLGREAARTRACSRIARGSPMRSRRRTSAAWCTATSSPTTSCS